ncbi:F-box/LRR-repeat protein At4g14103-like, partial [Olea europaea var. sylvestris]|uniref:F-box/LRR-repeat protein At4g14103-like n=1 Tax=Olea europaea var. sylvestris TaxID=158386 RepID=UPI000C1D26B0
MTSKTRRGNNLPSEIGDRFSCLSDEIISHILSFLPVKSAVRTSILSKRWQNLWNFTTNLEFEENTLIATSSVYDVEHVLSCCTSPHINKFSLTVNCYVHDERLESWINYVIKRNVRELRLEGPVFPHCIFTCKTLTVLELESGVLFDDEDIPTCSDIDSDSDTDSDVLFDNKDIRIPTSFDLPNLKTFRSCLLYYSCDFMEKLLSSSPLLEDLTIEGTVTSDFIFDLSCPLLKRLKIVLRGRKERKDVQCKIVINAPNLEYLELVDISTVEYDVENLTSIAEVKIDTRWEVFVNRSILWLFRAIDTLKSLSLHDIFIS